jgi:hypothetical protein
MDALFEPTPHQWGLRGDPHLWAAMQDRLTGVPVPRDTSERLRLVRETFRDLVGLYPEDRGDGSDGAVYRKDLDTGGMSAGRLDLPAWRARLIPLLASRAEKASAGRPWEGDPDEIPLLWARRPMDDSSC